MLELRNRIKWQMLFRAAFLMTMAVSGAVLHYFYSEPVSESLLVLLVSGCGFSALSFFVIRFMKEKFVTPMAWAQIFWDLLYTSVLIYLTGGIYSAFVMLYALQILAAAAVLSSSGSIGAVGGSMGGLVTIVLYQNGLRSFSELQIFSRTTLFLSMLMLFGGAVAQFFRSREKLARSLKQTEANLQDLSHLHSAIVDHIPSGIIYLDSELNVCLMNPAAIRIVGEKSLNRSLENSNLEILLKAHGRYESEIEFNSGKKSIGHHRTFLPDGGSVIVFQDVTDLKDLEKKIALKEKLASVGQLAAGIAHEIRNPLASLSGSIQLLSTELKLESQFEKLMRIILRETDRLDHLANSFLNYARPSELQLERISVSQVIEEVLDLARNTKEFGSGKVELHTNIPKDIFCVCDLRQFKQIFWNLLINALQSIPENGAVNISVEKRTHENRSTIRFIVQDTGEGMEDAIKEKIFDPFFTTKISGSGLGLSLVYQMVKSHNGRLGVESKKGVGTIFWFELLENGPQIKLLEQGTAVSAA
ncbi:MAG: histidine kinase [Bacteriovoracaceae bacterium]|nr:histidine kinase [Bacteriovoracaceae bacterium]